MLCGGSSLAHAQSAAKTPQNPAQPAPTGTAARDKAILAHLNAALRFYRDSQAPIQKVGEPSDLLYRDQAVTLATQIAGFAFQSAKAEAALGGSGQVSGPGQGAESQAQRLQSMRSSVEQQISALKAQDADLEKQLASNPKQAGLQQQRDAIQGQLELQTAMASALTKITTMADASGGTGLGAEIDQLERSAPGLASGKATTVAPTLENFSAARSAGVTSQAKILFELLGARQDIDNVVKEDDDLHTQAMALRTPLIGMLNSTIAQGQALSQPGAAPTATSAAPTPASSTPASSTPAPSSPPLSSPASTRKSYDALTKKFVGLSAATVPLSQETLALEQDRAGLEAWRTAVNQEYTEIIRSLLLRVGAIAFALCAIFGLGEVWRRAATRYVHDVRRRRQLLVLRRLAVGFFSGVVLIFGLVTQFNSLATFAGFITAGIAVGLQTILLSVAAYFFIIGRYGVKVGDRITISGVTGDVIEVGLVRFYMLEMAGSGTDLYPTGRVAVFSNAVLFQAGTPLYKQMPGTEYAWHQLTVKLASDSDYRGAVQEILKSVQSVYGGYKGEIEKQHKNLESWMDSSIDAPGVQSTVQLVDGGLQLAVRFPVMIRQAAGVDGRMTESLLQLMSTDAKVKSAVASPPVIQAAVKG